MKNMNTILFLRSNCNYYKKDGTKQVRKAYFIPFSSSISHTQKYNKISVMGFCNMVHSLRTKPLSFLGLVYTRASRKWIWNKYLDELLLNSIKPPVWTQSFSLVYCSLRACTGKLTWIKVGYEFKVQSYFENGLT